MIESFGGFLTIGGIGGAVLLVVFFILRNPLAAISDAPLQGEPVASNSVAHVSDVASLQITPGDPPAGGPMFAQPLRQGIFDEPVPDGNAIHSLEHGLVWITYRPDLLSDEELSRLRDVANDFGRDAILSPRPANAMAVAAVSWGRILRLDAVDAEQLRSFIDTNRNRSPEAGIR